MASEPDKVDKPSSAWLVIAQERSVWGLLVGRSIINALIGNFFTNKNNTAALIAIALVATLCWLAFAGNEDIVPILSNIIFVVIGYYFGAKSTEDSNRDSN